MNILLLLFVFITIAFIIKSKIKIDFPSFVKKSMPLDRGKFGVYCFTGKQGTGKTYAVVKFLKRNKLHRWKDYKIYSNVTLKGIDYIPITNIDQLLALSDERYCFIVFDEIFSLMSKSKKQRGMMEEFLPQMRKQKNIFMTTAQEWLELDISFRRFVRVQIDCTTIPLGRFGGVLIEEYFDATHIKWSTLENEYISPVIDKKISKYEKTVMLSYDTNERIKPMK